MNHAASYKPGQILRFTYTHKVTDEDTGDRHKEVLVLHPNWQGQIHAIDLKRLTAAEREVLDLIMDPRNRGKQHRIPLVNDILKRMNPVEEIKNPQSFYSKFVKVFLRHKDAYRIYWPAQMVNTTVVKATHVSGKVINPKPLFKGPESPEEKKAKADLIAKVAAEKGVNVSKNVGLPKPELSKAEKMANIRKAVAKLYGKPASTNKPVGTTKTTGTSPQKNNRLTAIKNAAGKIKKPK